MKKPWTPYIIYLVLFVFVAAFPYKYFSAPDYPMGAYVLLMMTAWLSAFILSLIMGIVQPSGKKWIFVIYVWLIGFLFDLIYHGSDSLINDPPSPIALLELAFIAAVIGMVSGSLIRFIRVKCKTESR